MATDKIALKNGRQTATFARGKGGYRPEWFRVGTRPMLRFKDHEWLNIGAIRVTRGALLERSARACRFGGRVMFAGTPVDWTVSVGVPADRKRGFTVSTRLIPASETIEVLEAMTSFELPYEYDGNEKAMTVISQQPVYRFEGGREINGAGFMRPIWYYGRVGRAHLTYPSSSPLLANRIAARDGSNERCTMLIGNWDKCTLHDIFAQPTRQLANSRDDSPFPDKALKTEAGRRGMKFLMGTVNWNCSLVKDPNVVVEPGKGLSQEITLDFAGQVPGGRWDAWLADGWERLVRIHLPPDGRIPAWEVARSRGASWVGAAEWLTDQFKKKDGCPGFFSPERGTCVYAPGTRPKWDNGVELFAGQFTGPVGYLGHVWGDRKMVEASTRLERIFAKDKAHNPQDIWTIGPTPMMVAVMRKAQLFKLDAEAREKVEDYVRRRTEYVLNPPDGGKRGDGGILAWDAYANLIAADLFDTAGRESAARELLRRVNEKLDGEFWKFNCAAEGDLVGAGNARPFGHGIAIHANALAWKRFGDPAYLAAAERFANLLLSMHCITWNESPAPDLDTRGWCHGSTGGRDQIAQIPPWETGHALQQLAPLILAGRARAGFYDVLWLHRHTGLAQYPKARTMKRLYNPDMTITYRPNASLPTEREFYLKLPYLAYENPWDQTMLAGYQGVEGIILSLFLGGGLVRAEDDRVLALVPAAAVYDREVRSRFGVQLWNPLAVPVRTRLYATIAIKRRCRLAYTGASSGTVSAGEPFTKEVAIPSRKIVTVQFNAHD
mgnify:CR=1 FL=1